MIIDQGCYACETETIITNVILTYLIVDLWEVELRL